MRKLEAALLAVCLCAFGCDDKNETSSICDKDCGAGSCYMKGTLEACLCDDGYTQDIDGVCKLCSTEYHLDGKKCVADGPCSGQCKGDNRTCTVVDGKPVCGCELGYQEEGNLCKIKDVCFPVFRYVNPNATGQTVYVTGEFDGWQHSNPDRKSTRLNSSHR